MAMAAMARFLPWPWTSTWGGGWLCYLPLICLLLCAPPSPSGVCSGVTFASAKKHKTSSKERFQPRSTSKINQAHKKVGDVLFNADIGALAKWADDPKSPHKKIQVFLYPSFDVRYPDKTSQTPSTTPFEAAGLEPQNQCDFATSDDGAIRTDGLARDDDVKGTARTADTDEKIAHSKFTRDTEYVQVGGAPALASAAALLKSYLHHNNHLITESIEVAHLALVPSARLEDWEPLRTDIPHFAVVPECCVATSRVLRTALATRPYLFLLTHDASGRNNAPYDARMERDVPATDQGEDECECGNRCVVVPWPAPLGPAYIRGNIPDDEKSTPPTPMMINRPFLLSFWGGFGDSSFSVTRGAFSKLGSNMHRIVSALARYPRNNGGYGDHAVVIDERAERTLQGESVPSACAARLASTSMFCLHPPLDGDHGKEVHRSLRAYFFTAMSYGCIPVVFERQASEGVDNLHFARNHRSHGYLRRAGAVVTLPDALLSDDNATDSVQTILKTLSTVVKERRVDAMRTAATEYARTMNWSRRAPLYALGAMLQRHWSSAPISGDEESVEEAADVVARMPNADDRLSELDEAERNRTSPIRGDAKFEKDIALRESFKGMKEAERIDAINVNRKGVVARQGLRASLEHAHAKHKALHMRDDSSVRRVHVAGTLDGVMLRKAGDGGLGMPNGAKAARAEHVGGGGSIPLMAHSHHVAGVAMPAFRTTPLKRTLPLRKQMNQELRHAMTIKQINQQRQRQDAQS